MDQKPPNKTMDEWENEASSIPYNPQGKTRKIIDAAWGVVKSVNHKVSLRWVFYSLLQKGPTPGIIKARYFLL